MKKNTIFIVIDSLYYDKTIGQEYRNNPMPFLEKLRKEGLNFTQMYSEAPYTEAALVSLLCGVDTLKKGGYLKKLYGKETIMQTFQKNGYDTFCNCVQPLVYPSYSYQGLTDEYYNVSFDFATLWSYRLKFYSERYKANQLDEKSLEVIKDLLADNLYTWEEFLKALQKKSKIVSFIYSYLNLENLEENLKKVHMEHEKFAKNPIQYTKELLFLGSEHVLFQIPTYPLIKQLSYEDRKKLNRRYKAIIRKMFFKNLFLNLKNNKLKLKPKEEKKGLIKAYFNAVCNRFMLKKIDYHIPNKKAAPSMDTTMNHFEKWLMDRKSDKPYFAYIHVDDCHSGEMFYSYDSNDFSKLDEEFLAIKKFVGKMPKKYKGNISYDVSLQYADMCLSRLYHFLEKQNMLDHVNIAICADHGSSYSFAPYRSNYVNNVHRENYNMPFVLWSKNMEPKEFNGFYNTKDIPATILDFNHISIPNEYDGISALSGQSREYVLLENVDGGCPDYNMRDILLGIRNKKYLVVMNLNVHKSFLEGTIHSIYDLIKDSEELYNLKDTIDKSEIATELEIIKVEFEKLKKDVEKNNFINFGEK